mmetsp:Transcript_4350/g.7258  ORF Transcript_4350/g.7258 Transcript_4350/m.7258 type:complete len:204 (+) Transcript_4350:914-1525(+)
MVIRLEVVPEESPQTTDTFSVVHLFILVRPVKHHGDLPHDLFADVWPNAHHQTILSARHTSWHLWILENVLDYARQLVDQPLCSRLDLSFDPSLEVGPKLHDQIMHPLLGVRGQSSHLGERNVCCSPCGVACRTCPTGSDTGGPTCSTGGHTCSTGSHTDHLVSNAMQDAGLLWCGLLIRILRRHACRWANNRLLEAGCHACH